ncbi:hypothetical protein C7974DRAFT_456028 [Boeremia exigua]|uniref:uncharacterized protein n=1 Tax=Boeremia exigua TaxID=749465 RepID=UPI001E8E52E2|nr:uncharacterized protein C7974DRAFT_456028 [Boeremia exigua]KAH6625706.1 hypothetical protein C7974DRAFT_456028 [Boeremia exigua]
MSLDDSSATVTPENSSATATPEKEALRSIFSDMDMIEGNRGNAANEGARAEQGAMARRKKNRASQRPKHNNADTATNDSAEASEGERDEPNNTRPSSPPSEAETVATEPLPPFPFGRALPRPPTTPYLSVPVLAHYEPRPLPSPNATTHGLFATQPIPAGTRLISERPLFTLPAPGDQLDGLMIAFHNLPAASLPHFWALQPAAPDACEQLTNLRFLTDRLAFALRETIVTPPAARSVAQTAELDAMLPKLQNAMLTYRVAARWHRHRTSLAPQTTGAMLPRGSPTTALFLARARIRHSCVPNCVASFDPQRGVLNVHAARGIAAGEELLLSALGEGGWYARKAERGAELRALGAECGCEACDEEGEGFEGHEGARGRAGARAVVIADGLTRVEAGEGGETDLPTLQTTLLSLLRDLARAGCASPELARWRCVLADRVLPALAARAAEGKAEAKPEVKPEAKAKAEAEARVLMKVARGHAREAERVARVCYGGDREDVFGGI